MDNHHEKHNSTQYNFFSKITFWYMIPILVKRYFKVKSNDDVPEVGYKSTAKQLGDELEKSWNKEKLKKCPSLWKAIINVFWLEFSIFGVVLMINELILVPLRPLAISQVLKYYSKNKKDYDITNTEAYTCAGLIVIMFFLSSILSHYANFRLQVLGMNIRVACCSIIYRKSLKLSNFANGKVTAGQITNLLSNDVCRFDTGTLALHVLWICPLQLIIVVSLMYLELGWISLVGIVFMVSLLPIQVYLGKKMSDLRLKIARATDERIRLMTEMISGIKVIKMYTWEKRFFEMVTAIRRLELHEIKAANYIRIFMKTCVYSPKFGVFFTLFTYVLTGNKINALYVFTTISFYDVLRQFLAILFTKSISDIAELNVSINRIVEYLLSEEIYCFRNIKREIKINIQGSKELGHLCLELNCASAKWDANSSNLVLNDIEMRVASNEHVAIVGLVGSGKSSIFQAILGELPLVNGSVTTNGRISYASQEPWLFTGNIRENILFGETLDKERYTNIVRACALDEDFSHFPYGDQTIVGERGIALSGGQRARVNLARCVYFDADIYLLDDPFSAIDAHVADHIFSACVQKLLKNKCVLLVTHQMQFLHYFGSIYVIYDGKISANGTFAEILKLKTHFSELFGQNSGTSTTDHYLTKPPTLATAQNLSLQKQFFESKEIHSGTSGNAFVLYLKSNGCFSMFFLLVLAILSGQLSVAASDYFTLYWLNMEQQHPDSPLLSSDYIYGYSAIIVCLLVGLCLQQQAFFSYCLQCCLKLHNNMLSGVINTSLKFFETNTAGRILNRFSKDMGVVDEQLPMCGIEAIQTFFRTVLGMILISMSNPYLIVSSVLFIIGCYLIAAIYHPTNYQVKILEGVARSPVYGHLNETIRGLTTVRAFGAQEMLKKDFDNYQNIHSSAWYFLLSCTRTFLFYIDVIGVAYLITVVAVMVVSEKENYAGHIGLAISQALTMLISQHYAMLQAAELENHLTSVERISEYSSMIYEDLERNEPLTSSWPDHGKIDFASVFLQYSNNGPYVLNDLSFSIEPKSKIGVVGRTGAGKSSLIAALFQLTRTKGMITIDGVDISKLPLESLRSKISCIPQEPILFAGTLKKNLDPFDLYSDDELWLVLEDVDLKNIVANFSSGLYHIVSNEGANFSVGQKQLICLARAILRKNKILVLDEATANVDPYTDTLIQTTIRKKFKECTVLTIAHRLNTVMDCNKVLVLDNGGVIEFDHPHCLLQNTEGIFYSMVQKTGENMAKSLSTVAESSFLNKFQKEE